LRAPNHFPRELKSYESPLSTDGTEGTGPESRLPYGNIGKATSAREWQGKRRKIGTGMDMP
jgi:hypothetical protein